MDRLIRLDAGPRDGLSGAPVADAAGKVFGLATSGLSRSYGVVVPNRRSPESSTSCSPRVM